MNMQKLLATTSILLLLLLASCSTKEVKYKIGVSQCSDDIWRNWQNAELRLEANIHEGVELRFVAAHDDSETQIQQVDSLVDSGIDLLIVAPNQLQRVSPAIDRAFDSGIPVIVFERKTNSHKYTAFMSADNYEMGHQMGQYIATRLEGKGKVLEILGLKGSSPAEDRHRGFCDALSDYPDIEIVASLQGDWTEESSYKAVKAYQGDLGKIDYVFGHNDRMAIGARKVFEERRLQVSGGKGLPLFCGIDGLPGEQGGIRLVRDSLLDATYIYPTRGDQLLQLALSILDGKPYEKETMLTSALVTHENANVLFLESDEVMRQSQKLDQLQQMANVYMERLDSQRTILWLTIILIILLQVVVVGTWLYHKQSVRLARERGAMEREQLDFYTQVSHELRTPLTLIDGPLTQLAESDDAGKVSPRTAELFDIVRRNVAQLTGIINKMLDVQVSGDSAKVSAETKQMAAALKTGVSTEAPAAPSSNPSGSPQYSVLIVDDNADIRTYLRSILQDRYQLFEAEDGLQGMAVARAEVPDLIVSDVMMPIMNGLEFCQQVKSDIVTSHIPVILLTARALNQHQIEGYESGADAYITKPFSTPLLLARIDNLLRNRRRLKDLWGSNKAEEEKTPKSKPIEQPAAVQEPGDEGKENLFITRIKEILETRMADSDLSVETIGADIGLSRVQLYRKVKALTGYTPVDLLRKARLEKARQMLLTTDLSVSEVAYKVGFTSPSYFSKCFKDEYGIVPGVARS